MKIYVTKSFLIGSIILFMMCAPKTSTINSAKTQQLFTSAKKSTRNKNYKKAIQYYAQILQRNSRNIEAHLGISGIYYTKGNWKGAREYLLEAIAIDPDYNNEMYFSLGLIEEQLEYYQSAANRYTEYLNNNPKNETKRQKAIKKQKQNEFIAFSIAHSVPFAPNLLNNNINTLASEYWAVMNADNSSFVFTRRVNHQEDLFMSSKTKEGYTSAIALPFNTIRNEAAHCISPDGKLIILTKCDGADSFGGCDLYYAQFLNGKWTKPKNMGQRINSVKWDAQPSLSQNGKTLYFSSKRKNSKGGKGGADIYMSNLGDDRRWSIPVSLGENINTKEHDESPYLHPDGQTLYFRSKGHVGLGGFDIFYAKKDPYTQMWTKAVNIGYPINSTGSDGALTVAYDGKTAYYATDKFAIKRGEKPNLDIVSFELYPAAQSTPVSYARLHISNVETGAPIKTEVQFYDLDAETSVHNQKSDVDGNILVSLITGKNYLLNINEKGYSFYSEHLEFDKVDQDENVFIQNIRLIPIRENTIYSNEEEIVLNNIFFETGSSGLLTQSMVEINNLANYLKKNPSLKIKILGYTDNIGSAKDNLKLSNDRAKKVYEAIITKGVSKLRLSYKGMGEANPIADNETKKGRQENRRTSFIMK